MRRLALYATACLVVGAVLLLDVRSAAADTPFRSVSLPPGIGTLTGITCPDATTCYAVGSAAGNGDQPGVIITSHDGGHTWTAQFAPGGVPLAGITCWSRDHCVAVGGSIQATADVAITTDGSTWRLAQVPSGTSPVFRVSCASATACLAAGDQNAQGLIASTDGGATWVQRAPPQTANGPGAVFAASCVDNTHCWVAGGGVWETSDLGATWTDRSPPQPPCPPGQGFCDASYSLLDAIAFIDATHGFAVGGVQCGGQGAGQCPSAVLATSDGGRSWTAWSAADRSTFPFVDDVSCTGSTCVAVAQTLNSSSVIMTSSDAVHWTAAQTYQGFINAVTCSAGGACIVVGGNGSSGALFASVPAALTPATTSSDRSVFSLSLLDPRDVSTDPRLLATNGLAAFLVALLLVFPSTLFNSTVAANYDEVAGWFGPLRKAFDRAAAAPVRLPNYAPLAGFVIVAALIAGLLDPDFGVNRHSVPIFTGMLGAIAFGTVVTGRIGAYWMRWRRHIDHHLKLYPAGLLIALACMVISRTAHFLPGYLYGVVSGVKLERDLDDREEGRLLALVFGATFVISLVAWFLWLPVKYVADQHAVFPLTAVDVLLAAVFVGGFQGILFGLIPIRFQPGLKLRTWSTVVWLAYVVIALVTLFHVLLRPRPSSNLTPFVVVLTLFVVFGACSVAFWAYFALRGRGGTVPAMVVNDPAAGPPEDRPRPRSSHEWDEVYTGAPPWDTGHPQPAIAQLAHEEMLTGRVLDIGCGTGEHALLAASLGCEAVGIDVSARAIAIAQRKAADRRLTARFMVGDALRLHELDERFDTVIDSGLFHVFDDEDRPRYVGGLHHVLVPGGVFHLMCFSDAQPGTWGPRRVTRQELIDSFSNGWEVVSIDAATFEVVMDIGTVQAWLAQMRRV